MSDLDPDLMPDPARFVLRPVQRNEVIEGDPRSYALELGRGNHAYVFTISWEEARDLMQLLRSHL